MKEKMKVPLFSGKKRCKDNKNNQHQSIEAHMTMKLNFDLTYGLESTCKLKLKSMLVSYTCNGQDLNISHNMNLYTNKKHLNNLNHWCDKQYLSYNQFNMAH